MTDQKSSLQVLIFKNDDNCKIVQAEYGWHIVWLTRAAAQNLAEHILDHLNEFPEVLPGGEG